MISESSTIILLGGTKGESLGDHEAHGWHRRQWRVIDDQREISDTAICANL